MNLDFSSMSNFDMCNRIQELIPRMDDESVNPSQKSSSMAGALELFGFEDQTDECFDCSVHGKICGKSVGESVLLIILNRLFHKTNLR